MDPTDRLFKTAGIGSGRKRRWLLILSIGVLIGLAGCVDALDSDDGAGDDLEYVPEEANMLIGVDMQMATDSEFQQYIDGVNDVFMDEFGEPMFDEGPEDFIDTFEEESGLDYAQAGSALVFGDMEEDPAAEDEVAVIIESGWDADEFVDAAADTEPYDYELTEYAGEEVLYVPDDTSTFGEQAYIGVLPGNLIVVGDEQMVTASLDIAYDGASSLSGPVVDLYGSMDDSGMVMTMDAEDVIDEDDLPDEIPDEDEDLLPPEFDPQQFGEMEAIGAAFYAGGNAFHLDTAFEFSTEGDAGEIADVIDGALSLWAGEIEAETGDEELADQLRDIEVTQDGTTVTTGYSINVDELVDITEDFIWMLMAFGDPGTLDAGDAGQVGTMTVFDPVGA